MPGVVVKSNAYISKTIVGSDTIIGEYAQIGYSAIEKSPYINNKICSNDICVIEKGLTIKKNAVIPCNSMVEYLPDIDEAISVVEDCH